MIERAASDRYLAHLLGGDRGACRSVVQALLDRGEEPRTIYEDLFKASLYSVGELWEQGVLSVAGEHLATAITEDLLGLVYPHALARERIGRTAVVTCSPDEYHQVGGRIVADSLEALGWKVHFLGANAAEGALGELLRQTLPELLAISVTLGGHLPPALRSVHRARDLDPTLKIVVGGQAFAGADLRPFLAVPGVRVATSLKDLEAVLAAWSPDPSRS